MRKLDRIQTSSISNPVAPCLSCLWCRSEVVYVCYPADPLAPPATLRHSV